MTRFFSRVLIVFACAGMTAAAADPCGCQPVPPTSRQLDRFGLERGWWNQAVLDAGIDKLVYLTADEEAVYAQSSTGFVTAFDAETGERLWSRLLGTSDAPSFPVVTNADQLLLATGMNLFAIDKLNGQLLWRLNLPRHPSTTPGINDVQAYIGTLDGSAYAFDLATIRQLFEDQLLPEWSNVTTVWRYRAGGAVTSPPVAVGPQVNFASEDGSLYSVDLNDGSPHFQFETNGPIQTPIGRNEDSLFIASDEVRLFCLNAQNGKLRWTFVAGTPIREEPQIVGRQVFVAAERGGLYALDTFNGQLIWHQTRATAFLAAGAETLFASDEFGNVLILSRYDGTITGSLPLRCMSVRVNNDRTDRAYLATPQGLIVCLREQGHDFPEFHKFPERKPMLPEFAEDEPTETEEPPATDEGAAP